MIDFRRDDLPELPALLAEPTAGMRLPTEAPAVADVGHICTPRDDWGGRCWCQPRSLVQAIRDISATMDIPLSKMEMAHALRSTWVAQVVVLSEWRGR